MEPFRLEGKARCTGHLASYVMVRVMWVDGAGRIRVSLYICVSLGSDLKDP